MRDYEIIYQYKGLVRKMRKLENEMSELRKAIVLAIDNSIDINDEVLLLAVIRVINEEGLDKPGRKQDVVMAKHYLRNYLRENTKLNLTRISMLTGGVEHANVLHSIRVHNDLIDISDPKYISIAKELNRKIKQYYEEENEKAMDSRSR